MSNFDSLIPDVLKLLDGSDLTSSIQSFSDKLGTSLVDKFKRNGEERVPKLYLSNVGKPLRQLYYDLKGFKGEALSQTKKFSFLYGDLIESLFLYLAEAAGHKVEKQQERVEFDEVSGKTDARIDGVTIDVKSCSPRSFEKFKFGKLEEDDPFGYISQLVGYWKCTKTERAAFIAIDKVSGEMCCYELNKDLLESYDLSGKIANIKEVISKDVEPERCYSDKPVSKTDKSENRILGTGCSYCGHRFHCWRDTNNGSGLQPRYYSTGVKYFTNLAKEPRLRNSYQQDNFIEFPVKETE